MIQLKAIREGFCIVFMQFTRGMHGIEYKIRIRDWGASRVEIIFQESKNRIALHVVHERPATRNVP